MPTEQKEPQSAIEEMYPMKKGVFILDPEDKIQLSFDVSISRRALKHIIENRKDNTYSMNRIKNMIDRIPIALNQPDFDVLNTKNQKYNSFISGKIFSEEKEGLMIVYVIEGKTKCVITAFYKARSGFKKYLK